MGWLLGVWLGFAITACSEDKLVPDDWPIECVVDYYVDSRLSTLGLEPVGQVGDANLVRRLTLDLMGRIPSYSEVREYSTANDSDKRGKLVDRLLNGPGFARHQTDELETLLMYPDEGDMRQYLKKAVTEDRRWDQMFRDLIMAEPTTGDDVDSSVFLKARLKDIDKMTNEVSVRFFGVNISCAQCHDHPLVSSWTQDHYYGMKSFFDRTLDNGGFVAERSYGRVSFTTTKGVRRDAKLMFLSGEVVDEPPMPEPSDKVKQAEKKLLDEAKKDKKIPPAPAYSRRARLVEAGLSPTGRTWMARSLVNRIWYRIFGNGLVMPVDQMHAENPSSHPELLQWLARDMIAHQFDTKRLIRGLVMSRTYSRESAWPGPGTRPERDSYAVASVKPMTPSQFSASLKVATLEPSRVDENVMDLDRESQLESATQAGRSLSSRFEMPREDMQISVSEALFLSNNQQLAGELLSGGLVASLSQMNDAEQIVDQAVQRVLLRQPDVEESESLTSFLKARSDRHQQACRDLVWLLLTSTEFRFNY